MCLYAYFTKINMLPPNLYSSMRSIGTSGKIIFFCVFLAKRFVTCEIFLSERVKENGYVIDAERR